MTPARRVLLVLALAAPVVACQRPTFVAERATRPYPFELHTTETVDIQVFRDGVHIELVNSTAWSHRDFDLWVNQRFVKHVDSMAAGEKLRLSLWDFYDERGEAFNAGGILRIRAPTPVRLVQMQADQEAQLIGLITIPEDQRR